MPAPAATEGFTPSPQIPGDLYVGRVVSVPFEENTYVFARPGRDDCVVFDPGLQPGKILELLDTHGLAPAAILLTHGHADHIAGNARLKDRWPDCPIVIGVGDEPKLSDPVANLSSLSGFDVLSPPADETVAGGDVYEAGGLRWRVLDTPGHCAGHVTYLLEAEASASGPVQVVGGDVLFQGSIGRTDFPDGDFDTLRDSVHTQLFPLPGDSVVYPGHGPTTTIDVEKRGNPFVGAPAGYIERPA